MKKFKALGLEKPNQKLTVQDLTTIKGGTNFQCFMAAKPNDGDPPKEIGESRSHYLTTH